MGSPSGGGAQTVTNKTEPWKEQKPYLTDIFGKAQSNYNTQQPQYFSGSTVAQPSDTTQTAQQLQTQRALNGSPAQTAANNQVTDTLNGAFLNSNPYLDQSFNSGANQLTKSYNNAVTGNTAGFAAGGRTGSGMAAFMKDQSDNTLGQNLQQLYANTYGQNYTNERTNQMRALGLQPGVSGQDYTDLNALSDVGSAQDTQNQAQLNDQVSRYNYNQNLPYNSLVNYMNLIQGNYGGSATQTTPFQGGGSPLGGILSGASAGAALGPWGAAGGAILGGLFR